MKSRNPSLDRPARIVRGQSAPKRAGPRGHTWRDASTEASPVDDITVRGGTIEWDEETDSLILTVGGGSGGSGGEGVSSPSIYMLNNSGQDLGPGAVVVVDETADRAVTVTDTPGSILIAGIVQDYIPIDATGRVLFNGYAAEVLTTGDIERGQYAQTSDVEGAAQATDDREAGSFGVVLTAPGTDFVDDAAGTESSGSVTSLSITMPDSVTDGTAAGRILFLALYLDPSLGAASVTLSGWTRIGSTTGFRYYYRFCTGGDTASASWTGSSPAAAAVLVLNEAVAVDDPIEDFAYDSTTAAAAVSGLTDRPHFAIAAVQAVTDEPAGWTTLAALDLLTSGGAGATDLALAGTVTNDPANTLDWTNPTNVNDGSTLTHADVPFHGPGETFRLLNDLGSAAAVSSIWVQNGEYSVQYSTDGVTYNGLTGASWSVPTLHNGAYMRHLTWTGGNITARYWRLGRTSAGGGTAETLYSWEIIGTVDQSVAGTIVGRYIGRDAAVTSPFTGADAQSDAIFAVNLATELKASVLLYGPDLGGGGGSEPTADAHISDTSDAHDASAISIADAGGHFTGTDVEAALQELGAGNTPIVAALSNPPTQAELEAAIGSSAGLVPGQAYLVIDSDTALGYRVWSTGLAFDYVPVVSPASDLGAIGSGIFNDFHGQWSASQYDATSGKLFFTYLNAAGDAVISSWDGSTLVNFTGHSALDPGDLHAQPALLIRSSDRKIIWAYSAHIGSTAYTRISTNAADVSAWGSETSRDAAIGGTDYTYHILYELSDGIYWFLRTYTGTTPGGTFNHAGAIWSYSKSTDNGATWSARTNVMSDATYGMYWMPSKTAADRVDFLVCDRSTFDATGGSLFHMYMVGGTFYETDGTEITATKPFNQTAMTEVWASDGTQRATPGQVILGADGHPRALFHEFESISPEDGHYLWNRWDGAAWGTAVEFAAAGSGAPRATCVFRDGDPYTVFYTKDSGGFSQVFMAVTADEGVTWTHQAITDAANDQSRLVTVRDGAPGIPVLWLADYVDDSTDADITGASWTPVEGSDAQRVVVIDGTGRGEAIIQRTAGGQWQISRNLGAAWEDLGGVTISTADPLPDGTADPGSSGEVSDAEHVHPAVAGDSLLLTVDAGTTTYSAAGDDVTVTYATVWGYDGDGPYYDSTGAVDGEQAILALDPSTGELAVIPMLP